MADAGKVEVRRVTSEDLALLKSKAQPPEMAPIDEVFAQQAAGLLIYAIAIAGDEPLGTCVLDLEDGLLQPELKDMWVYPSARRRGAGRALSRYVEDEARKAGFEEVLLAVDPNNEKAIPLYVSLGYSPTGDHLFVEVAEEFQVADPSLVSHHWSIFRKSLRVN